jgi:hypothetical protein
MSTGAGLGARSRRWGRARRWCCGEEMSAYHQEDCILSLMIGIVIPQISASPGRPFSGAVLALGCPWLGGDSVAGVGVQNHQVIRATSWRRRPTTFCRRLRVKPSAACPAPCSCRTTGCGGSLVLSNRVVRRQDRTARDRRRPPARRRSPEAAAHEATSPSGAVGLSGRPNLLLAGLRLDGRAGQKRTLCRSSGEVRERGCWRQQSRWEDCGRAGMSKGIARPASHS